MNETAERFIRLVIRLIVLYFVIVVVGGIIFSSLRMSAVGILIFTVLGIAFIIYALSSIKKRP